jgi:acetyltransferase-like isoleucine patch superfamily enzyme
MSDKPSPPVESGSTERALNSMDRLILRIKRADSPVTRLMRRTLLWLLSPVVRPLPRFILRPLRLVYEAHYMVIVLYRAVLTVCYRNPVFQSKCASFGRNVVVQGKLPFVSGHVQIEIGNDVVLGGNLTILSGALFEKPRLILKDRASLGWNVTLVVNREIVIEEDARIPHDCRISDSDGHPREADLRRANLPPSLKQVLPVRICRDVWLGNGSHVMKGVTIGEGAIIGANSVVISNIPPYALALGNPAEVLFKNYGIPSTQRKKAATQSADPAPEQSS